MPPSPARTRRWKPGPWLLLPALLTGCAADHALVVSANDGKPLRVGDSAATVVPDSLSVYRVRGGRLGLVGAVAVPASMTGPPESVKLTPDGRYAIVTAGQRIAAGSTITIVPDDTLSVVDLSRPAAPRVVQSVRAGMGATGVAIDAAGKRVLVANRLADSVSVFAFDGGRLRPRPAVALPAGSRPVSVRFAKDARNAFVVSAAGRLFVLDVGHDTVQSTDRSIAIGSGGGAIALSPDGRTAYVANPAGTPAASVVVVDVASLRVSATVPVGRGLEGFALSPRGDRLAVTLLNGTNLAAGEPGYATRGIVALFAVTASGLKPAGEIATGPLCQGAAWSRDGRHLFLQCAGERAIETFHLIRGRLVADPAAPLSVTGRPGAMASTATR